MQAGLEYLQRRRLHNLPGQPTIKGHSFFPNYDLLHSFVLKCDKFFPQRREKYMTDVKNRWSSDAGKMEPH